MRCGRILVEGEAEDIIPVPVPPKAAKPRQSRRHHGKKKNPFSSVGLDKFASLNAELSAKREYIARKTGTPEAMVRFCYTSQGWMPVVITNGIDGGVLSLPPIMSKQDNEISEKYNGIQKEEDEVKADEGCEKGVNGCGTSRETAPVIMPWWSGYARTSSFGFLTASAMLVIKSAAAMAAVMVVGSLQRLWLGGLMCMKSFIDIGFYYFSDFFLYWKRIPEIKASPAEGSLQVQQPSVASPENKMIASKREPVTGRATDFSAPKNSTRSQELNTQQLQQEGKKKKNNKEKFVKMVSMNDRPRRPIKLQQSQSLNRSGRREGRGAMDCSVGATVMILLLFFLVFYGKLCAICFTSALWYVLPKLTSDSNNPCISNNNNNSKVVIDLQSREYKKKVIMDGLLDRSHNRAI